MALSAGSVTIDGSGEATGSGLSIGIYNAFMGAVSLDADAKKKIADTMGPVCEALASAIIDHVTANAEVTVQVGASDSGLQRSTTVGTATDAPVGTVTLATKGTVA